MASKKAASKYATKATKDNPIRYGKLEFYLGARLEAMDNQKWYLSRIVKINEGDSKVLIHFDGWNSRHDRWLTYDSELLRPVSKQIAKDQDSPSSEKDFQAGDYVLAKWSNARHYPARILRILNETTAEVEFYDGFKKTLSKSSLKADKKKTFDAHARKFQEEACQPSVGSTESSSAFSGTILEDVRKRIRRQHAGPVGMADYVTSLPVKRSRKGEDGQELQNEKSYLGQDEGATQDTGTSFFEPASKRQKLEPESNIPSKKHPFWKLHSESTKGGSNIIETKGQSTSENVGQSSVTVKTKPQKESKGDGMPPGEDKYPPIERKRKKSGATLKIKLDLKRFSGGKSSVKKKLTDSADIARESSPERSLSQEVQPIEEVKEALGSPSKDPLSEAETVRKPILMSPRGGLWRAPKPAVVKGKGRLPQSKHTSPPNSEAPEGEMSTSPKRQRFTSITKQDNAKVDLRNEVADAQIEETKDTTVPLEVPTAKVGKKTNTTSVSSPVSSKTVEDAVKKDIQITKKRTVQELRKSGRRERRLTEKGLEIQQLLKRKEERIKKSSRSRTLSEADAVEISDEQKPTEDNDSRFDNKESVEVCHYSEGAEDLLDGKEQGHVASREFEENTECESINVTPERSLEKSSAESGENFSNSSNHTDKSPNMSNEPCEVIGDLSPPKQVKGTLTEEQGVGVTGTVLPLLDQFRKSLADKLKKHQDEESMTVEKKKKPSEEHCEKIQDPIVKSPITKPSLKIGQDGVIRVVDSVEDIDDEGNTNKVGGTRSLILPAKDVGGVTQSSTDQLKPFKDDEAKSGLDQSPAVYVLDDSDDDNDDVNTASPLTSLSKMVTMQNVEEIPTAKKSRAGSSMSEKVKETDEVFKTKSLEEPIKDPSNGRVGNVTEKRPLLSKKFKGKSNRTSSKKRIKRDFESSFVSMVVQERPSQVDRKTARTEKEKPWKSSPSGETSFDSICSDDKRKYSNESPPPAISEKSHESKAGILRVKPSPLAKLKLRKGSFQSLAPPSRKQIVAAKIQKRIRGQRFQMLDNMMPKYALYPSAPDVMQTVHSKAERPSSPTLPSMITAVPYSASVLSREPGVEMIRPRAPEYLYPYGGLRTTHQQHHLTPQRDYPRPVMGPEAKHPRMLKGPPAVHDPFKAKVVVPQFTALKHSSGVVDLDKVDIISGRLRSSEIVPHESRDSNTVRRSPLEQGNSGTVSSNMVRVNVTEDHATDSVKVEEGAVSPKLSTTVFEAKKKRLDMLMGKITAQVKSEPPSTPPLSSETDKQQTMSSIVQPARLSPFDSELSVSDTESRRQTVEGLTRRSTFYLEVPGTSKSISRPVDILSEKSSSTTVVATTPVSTIVTVYPVSPQKPPLTYVQSGHPSLQPPPYPQHREMLRFVPPDHRDLVYRGIRPVHPYTPEYMGFLQGDRRPPPPYPGIPVSNQYRTPMSSYYRPYDMMQGTPPAGNDIRPRVRPGYAIVRGRYVPVLPHSHDRNSASGCQIPNCKCKLQLWAEQTKSTSPRLSSASASQQHTVMPVSSTHKQPTSMRDNMKGASSRSVSSVSPKESHIVSSSRKPVSLPLSDSKSRMAGVPAMSPTMVHVDPSDVQSVRADRETGKKQKIMDEQSRKISRSTEDETKSLNKQTSLTGKEGKKEKENKADKSKDSAATDGKVKDKSKEKARTPLRIDTGSKRDTSSAIVSPTKERKEKDHGPFVQSNTEDRDRVLAPREFVVEIDPGEFRCTVKGCDKAFRKPSFLDYHIRYYHSPRVPFRRRRSSNLSVSSPDSVSGSALGSPNELQTASKRQTRLSLLDSPGVRTPNEDSMSIRSGYASSVSVMTDDNLSDGDKADDSSDEYDDSDFESLGSRIADDVIRCKCQTDDEMGFMIQCEQCLTWQHGDCVHLTVESVPSNYLCYICSNPKGLRPGAKYTNNFEWYRRGKLPKLSSATEKTPDNINDIMLASHALMTDIYNIFDVLKGIKKKLLLLREPDHPLLRCWKGKTTGDGSNNKDASRGASLEKDVNREMKTPNKSESAVRDAVANVHDKTKADTEAIVQEKKKKEEGNGNPNLQDNEPVDKHASLTNAENTDTDKVTKQSWAKESDNKSTEKEPKKITIDDKMDDELTTLLEPSKPEDSKATNAQINLLNHIEKIESELSSRLDEMEGQLDVLEEEYDKIERDGKENAQPKQLKYRIPDISCLVHQLQRINRYLVNVS